MTRLHAFFLLSVLSPWVWGQVVAPPDTQGMDAARFRITTQRQQDTQVFDQEDQACLLRFAVTACQNDVAKRRRSMLADLRRQELVLNEAARRETARTHLAHLKEKAVGNAARQAEPALMPAVPTSQSAQPDSTRSPVVAQPTPVRASPTAKVIETVDSAVLAQRRRAYVDKQEALVRRRQERDKRLQTPSKPGLPTPP